MSYAIGIDLHKKTSQVAVLKQGSDAFVLEKSIRTWTHRFEEVLQPFAPAKVLVEASTVSRWVAPYLRSLGHDVVVADPNFAVMYASRQANCKNEQTDARALAFACAQGHFRAIYEPTEEQRPIAELLGTRTSQVRRRTAAINRVRALYSARGIELGGGQADTFWSRVKHHASGVRVLPAEPLLDELAMLEDLVEGSDRRLKELADAHPVARRLMTMPGVGPIVSLSFYVKIGDPKRFRNPHEVESYLGLVPSLHTSGGPGQGGRLSKQGSSALRALMLQAAWALVCSSEPSVQPLRNWFLLLDQRRGTGRAITALARKMVGILFAMWRDEKNFEHRLPKPVTTPRSPSPRPRRYQLRSSKPAEKV